MIRYWTDLILWTDGANRRFEFHKRSQPFLRVHNETLSVAAIRVCNPDRYPPGKYDFRSKTKSQRQLKSQGFRHKYKAES